MDAKPAGWDECFLDARGVRMRYFTAGDGPPLVLVHGLAGAAANWIELGALLGRRHRLVVPELPGHSGSAPLPAAPNLDAYADRVRLVVEHERALPATFVGHSFGGLVSLRLALRHPEAVSALVLAGSAGISSSRRWAEFWISVSGLVRPAKLVAPLRGVLGRHPALRLPIFGRWQTSDTRSLSPRMVEAFLAAAPLHSDVFSAGQVLVQDDPRTDLEGVHCPCLVVWGARDYQVPIGDAFEYARRLRAPLRTIADCGHLLIGERPEAVAHAIEEFLREPKVPLRAMPLEPAIS